jgi:ethanolamine utilization microcompartment shell protein EutS
MKIEIIKSPSKGTVDMLMRRIGNGISKDIVSTDAVGLVQGAIIDMICATDIAEKAADVKVLDIRGNCPQNAIMIAIFGDTSSVESAISAIRLDLEKEKNLC